jgi:hypothetical protein
MSLARRKAQRKEEEEGEEGEEEEGMLTQSRGPHLAGGKRADHKPR